MIGNTSESLFGDGKGIFFVLLSASMIRDLVFGGAGRFPDLAKVTKYRQKEYLVISR